MQGCHPDSLRATLFSKLHPDGRGTLNDGVAGIAQDQRVLESAVMHPDKTLQNEVPSRFDYRSKNRLEILCQEPVSK